MTTAAVDQLLSHALSLHRAGRWAEAQALYERALAAAPRHADAMHLLGVLLSQCGRPAEGAEWIVRAVEVDPKPMYRANLVRSLLAAGRFDDAGNVLAGTPLPDAEDEALRQSHVEALHGAGRRDEAVAAAREAVRRHPVSAAALNNLGICLTGAGRAAEAAEAHGRAAALAPRVAPFQSNLAGALVKLGRHDAAVDACRRALSLDPRLAVAHNNLGNALRRRGDLAEAVASLTTATSIAPDFADAHFNLANVLLETGDYERAWREYEWRWRMPGFAPPSHGGKPRWDGGRLDGRTLMVHGEQGFGDVLQFARYLPLLHDRGGGRVVFVCQDELRSLLSAVEGADVVVGYTGEIPPFDVYAPLLSLPLILQTGGVIPPPPYLEADAELAATWSRRLQALRGGDARPRVGLAWSGNPDQEEAAQKQIPFELLAGALRGRGATFVSLQKGAPARELQNHAGGLHVVDPSADLTDFAQTAAVVANLDLVISIDTAVAHLAGAMGRPTWVLLYADADYRWPRTGCSPWYPQARLFRQSQFGDWGPVLSELDGALRRWEG
jgi:tetratricopeptide (TPR) repeat protein